MSISYETQKLIQNLVDKLIKQNRRAGQQIIEKLRALQKQYELARKPSPIKLTRKEIKRAKEALAQPMPIPKKELLKDLKRIEHPKIRKMMITAVKKDPIAARAIASEFAGLSKAQRAKAIRDFNRSARLDPQGALLEAKGFLAEVKEIKKALRKYKVI